MEKEELLKSNGKKPRKGKVIECKICGKFRYISPSRLILFCSRKCQFLSQKTNNEQSCIICQNKFYCSKSQLKYRNRKTCSNKCRARLQIFKAEQNRILNPPSEGVLRRRIRYSKKMDNWRKAIFERDNWTCQECGKRGGYLEADHIKPFVKYIKLRFDINNGRTLCRPCHMQTDTWGRPKCEKLQEKV